MPTWKFDQRCLIDACMNDDLIDEIGLEAIVELVVVELRAVQRLPHIAAHSFPIQGDIVYLRAIGRGVVNGRVRSALMLAYTLDGWTIEPLWVFKARVEAAEEEIIDSGPLGAPSILGVLRPKANADGEVTEAIERQIARELEKARRRRPH